MAKTFDALRRAEKEIKIKTGGTGVSKDTFQNRPYIPSGFKLPTQAEEEYRRMKHHITSSGSEGIIKTILFSSSSAGEGNSTVLINFAITLVSEGDKVLLVDANLRNPVLHDVFDLDNNAGLTELTMGDADLAVNRIFYANR